DPKHTFTGIDTVSRPKNNFSEYGAHYSADLSPRVREDLYGSFFLYNSGFLSPYGFSFGKDLRGTGEARTIVSLSRHDTASFGVTAAYESVTNSYITDASFSTFPIERNEIAVYAENRYEVASRLFLSGGVRAEYFRTPSIPGDGYSRPFFPASSISRFNPMLSAAYVAGGARLHASFGMGLRPPSGFELAFTDNPALKPERTRSIDAGVEQKVGRLLTLDATYFHNRYYDLIVTLGGSLAGLSHYQSANLANSQAQGGGVSARPAAGPVGVCHRLLHAAHNPHPFARRLQQSGAAAVCRRTAVHAPPRELRECGRDLYPRTAGRRPLRLLPRPHAFRRTLPGGQQWIVLEFRLRQRRRQPELHPRSRRQRIRQFTQCAQSPIRGSVPLPVAETELRRRAQVDHREDAMSGIRLRLVHPSEARTLSTGGAHEQRALRP